MDTIAFTPLVREYLRLVAVEHIDGDDDAREKWDEIWEQMEQHERDSANEAVLAIFGEWLL